jgi:cell division septation protein DedD/nucleoid DNA-binding protein
MARDISVYLRELLFRHDCVIIPGFGAFIGNYIPARIDRSEGLFYPPARKITFNRHLTGNDGLLIGHISSQLGIGYGEARDIVSNYAESLRQNINTGTAVILDHLGTFSLNREGTIIFEPDSGANYLLSSYGLTSYHRQPVSDFDIRKKVLEINHGRTGAQPSVRRLLTRAAVIIPLLVALTLVPFNERIFKGKLEESNMNPLATAELEFNRSQIIADSTPVQTEPVAEAVTEQTPETAVTVPEETTAAADDIPLAPATPQEYRYLVIIGSFKAESNAEVMAQKLRTKGFDAEVIGGPDGFSRVSAASFATLGEAEVSLNNLKPSYTGAWIHKTR